MLNPALEVAAETIIAESIEWIPIDERDLRDGMYADSAKDGTIKIKNDLPYAKYQYFKELHHIERNGIYEPLRDFFPGDYSEAYDKLQENPPAAWKKSIPEWIDRVFEDKTKKENVTHILKQEILRNIKDAQSRRS